MDFTVRNGNLDLTKESTILTDIYCTMSLQRTGWFYNSDFGVDWKAFPKINTGTMGLLQQEILRALQWIISAGRAKSITCLVEKDVQNINQVNVKVDAIQADGIPITYIQYRPVGMGPTTDYAMINGQTVSLG